MIEEEFAVLVFQTFCFRKTSLVSFVIEVGGSGNSFRLWCFFKDWTDGYRFGVMWS